MFIPAVNALPLEGFFAGIFDDLRSLTGFGGGGGNCGAGDFGSCDSSCRSGQAELDGNCLFPQICCRDLWVCGDLWVDGPTEECDGNARLNGGTCENQGFYGGDLYCYPTGHANQCTYNTTQCTNCGNGTCDPGETCAGCLIDCEGEQADCGANQNCTNITGVGTCVVEAPSICNDTTPVGNCSSSEEYGQPWYCNATGILIENCSTCGCLDGYECNVTNGGCVEEVIVAIPEGGSQRVVQIEPIKVELITQIEPSSVRKKDTVEIIWGISTHNLEVKKININRNTLKKSVELVVSNGKDSSLEIKENIPAKVDLDNDGSHDVEITVSDVDHNDFNMEVKELEIKESFAVDSDGEMEERVEEIQLAPENPLLGPFIEPINKDMVGFVVVNLVGAILILSLFYNLTRAFHKKK